jgi:hypothetical protein
MGESKRYTRRLSRRTPGNFFPRKLCEENLPPFGRVCVALFGDDKPGQALAERLGRTDESTVRLANLYIKGKTPPSYEALMVVLDELRPRKRA